MKDAFNRKDYGIEPSPKSLCKVRPKDILNMTAKELFKTKAEVLEHSNYLSEALAKLNNELLVLRARMDEAWATAYLKSSEAGKKERATLETMDIRREIVRVESERNILETVLGELNELKWFIDSKLNWRQREYDKT